MEQMCELCNKIKSVSYSSKLGKYICHVCYKKNVWRPKKVTCARCKRELPMHAKGLCRGCYNSVFHIDKVKAYNAQKQHHISMSLYKSITKTCIICGFDKIVDLHHIDSNHHNTSDRNLIGLCPNHHKMIHDRRYEQEILTILKSKGFEVPKTYESDEIFKKNISQKQHKYHF